MITNLRVALTVFIAESYADTAARQLVIATIAKASTTSEPALTNENPKTGSYPSTRSVVELGQ